MMGKCLPSPSPPKSPLEPEGSSRRQLHDDRKAVTSTTRERENKTLLPLPPNSPPTSRRPLKPQRRLGTCAAGLCSKNAFAVMARLRYLLQTTPEPDEAPRKTNRQDDEEHRRRWYRVHPITDEIYSVRPDPGLAGRSDGHPDAMKTPPMFEDSALRERVGTDPVKSRLVMARQLTPGQSVPHGLDRMAGMEGASFEDTFVNFCKICYDRSADVVVLPCRHGGFCEFCLKRAILMKPEHKGGCSCPWCRKKITEVIKLYDEGAIRMYGYAISAGNFFAENR